jgi:hypothetical protein
MIYSSSSFAKVKLRVREVRLVGQEGGGFGGKSGETADIEIGGRLI